MRSANKNHLYKWLVSADAMLTTNGGFLVLQECCEQTENQGTTGKKKRLQEVKYENLKEKE